MSLYNCRRPISDPKKMTDEELGSSMSHAPLLIMLLYFVGAGCLSIGILDYLFLSKTEKMIEGASVFLLAGMVGIIGARWADLSYECLVRHADGLKLNNAPVLSSASRWTVGGIVVSSIIIYIGNIAV